MADPRVQDTLAVMVACTGAGTLLLLVVSILTGGGWWIPVVLAVATVWFAIRLFQERRLGGEQAGPADS